MRNITPVLIHSLLGYALPYNAAQDNHLDEEEETTWSFANSTLLIIGGVRRHYQIFLAITMANYLASWDTLTKRYNDSILLERREIQALFKLTALTRKSVTEPLLEGFERIILNLDQLVQL